MRFDETDLAGVFLIGLDRMADERGFFARTYCEREFTAHGLDGRFVQCNLSHNTARGTLRGLHFQREPRPETKLVRCIRGAIYDVVLDLRKDSATYLRWVAVELNARNSLGLYIPAGLAHGFQTLEDDTDVWYQMGEFYAPELAAGVRWNDPAFGIRWPIGNPILSDKDRSYPDYIP
jgi:dTDP-4-dehydrorhamnose 3,5-epimerase